MDRQRFIQQMAILDRRQQHLAQRALVGQQQLDDAEIERLTGVSHLQAEGRAVRLQCGRLQQLADGRDGNAVLRVRKHCGIEPDSAQELLRGQSESPRHLKIAAQGPCPNHGFRHFRSPPCRVDPALAPTLVLTRGGAQTKKSGAENEKSNALDAYSGAHAEARPESGPASDTPARAKAAPFHPGDNHAIPRRLSPPRKPAEGRHHRRALCSGMDAVGLPRRHPGDHGRADPEGGRLL
ncbi:protein of unknown function (plasmid) [Cupriavidus taiwanensis]|uniref:Uncharacterized protein n=1 Tax=Cupriavidus taiwanensis TaxID=164546 RepID=A0A375I7N8_9BURK|nr:hypothetical protein CT19425_U350030 [Cupriavidus taiwanensis]SPK74867.1 protein of unknown function [Cupriavidus taiwanensis]